MKKAGKHTVILNLFQDLVVHYKQGVALIELLAYRLGLGPTGAASKPENIRGKAGKLSGHALTYNRQKGFTLIELLVVVLIIGILAAVAVPQYQKAVWKARLARPVLFANNAEKALSLYVLEHGWPAPTEDNVGYSATGTNPDISLDIDLCPTDSSCQDDFFSYYAGTESAGYYTWQIRLRKEPAMFIFCDTYPDGHQECSCSDDDEPAGKLICNLIPQLLPRNWN